MSIIGNILMLFIALHSGEVIGKTTYLQSTKGKSAKQTLAVHKISQQQNRIPKWAQRQELCVEDMLHATKQGLEQRWTDGDQGTG